MDATPSVRPPADAGSGIPRQPPDPLRIGPRIFTWGERTFVMGILNVTPDSFSGDGLLQAADPIDAALRQAREMVDDGAHLLDVGGQSTRPGHIEIPIAEELERVVPVIAALRGALPDVPISVDTTRVAVAAAALDAGADLINDVWGVGDSDDRFFLAAERNLPIVVMHNRAEARYTSVVAEVIADLARAIDRALAAGVAWEHLLVDPGIGFGKTAEQNLAVLLDLDLLAVLGRPIVLGTSRKSTIGKVLDLPADQRVEGTLATTALGVRAGADIVRVHDVRPNVRAARMADAIVRGWSEPPVEETR
jgi:dihydropteroate synthase